MKNALSKDEYRDDCPDRQQLSFPGECETFPVGTFRTQGLHRGCQACPIGTFQPEEQQTQCI